VPKVFYMQPGGVERMVEAAGDSVMQTAVRNGVTGVVGQCGGQWSCATCHVFLAEEHAADFPAVREDEDEMLDVVATDRQDNSRLSCQLVLSDGHEIRVTVPEAQL
jgi:ferredoxin, 2Fe-2S